MEGLLIHLMLGGNTLVLKLLAEANGSRLLNAVKRQGGADNPILINRKLVKVDIEKAVTPMATLIECE